MLAATIIDSAIDSTQVLTSDQWLIVTGTGSIPTAGTDADGVTIRNSARSITVTNGSTIEAGDVGIWISSSTMEDGIANSGTIASANEGIAIWAGSNIAGRGLQTVA